VQEINKEFQVTIEHNGENEQFRAVRLQMGYVFKYLIRIEDTEIYFEADEEGEYRALVRPEQMNKKRIDRQLLEKLSSQLKKLSE
jgi:hypothetical protein